jgi:hypothetical protein
VPAAPVVEDLEVFLAARSYQRTTHLPGELAQLDWWETDVEIPVGKCATRQAFGLVTSLPHLAAYACVLSFSKTTADFCPALVAASNASAVCPRPRCWTTTPPWSRRGGAGRRSDVPDAVTASLTRAWRWRCQGRGDGGRPAAPLLDACVRAQQDPADGCYINDVLTRREELLGPRACPAPQRIPPPRSARCPAVPPRPTAAGSDTGQRPAAAGLAARSSRSITTTACVDLCGVDTDDRRHGSSPSRD